MKITDSNNSKDSENSFSGKESSIVLKKRNMQIELLKKFNEIAESERFILHLQQDLSKMPIQVSGPLSRIKSAVDWEFINERHERLNIELKGILSIISSLEASKSN